MKVTWSGGVAKTYPAFNPWTFLEGVCSYRGGVRLRSGARIGGKYS